MLTWKAPPVIVPARVQVNVSAVGWPPVAVVGVTAQEPTPSDDVVVTCSGELEIAVSVPPDVDRCVTGKLFVPAVLEDVAAPAGFPVVLPYTTTTVWPEVPVTPVTVMTWPDVETVPGVPAVLVPETSVYPAAAMEPVCGAVQPAGTVTANAPLCMPPEAMVQVNVSVVDWLTPTLVGETVQVPAPSGGTTVTGIGELLIAVRVPPLVERCVTGKFDVPPVDGDVVAPPAPPEVLP